MSSLHSLLCKPNVDDSYDNTKLLIESDLSVLQLPDNRGNLPIHAALFNPRITLRIIQLLLNGWRESISQPNHNGFLPIHYLCSNKGLDEAVSVDILNILIEASPESVQREESDGALPIHKAAWYGMSLKFIKIIVNAYPESVGIVDGIGSLPIHIACMSDNCRLDNVKYLLEKYPGSVDIEASVISWLPIHCAAANSEGSQKADIIKYMLMKDPTYASKMTEDEDYPLHLACYSQPNLTAIQLLFDAYPEAVLKRDNKGKTPLDRSESYRSGAHSQRAQVINFLQTQQFYAERAQDHNAMTTLDENEWLPLHHALKNNASLGSIKLLIEGNTSAVRVPDNNMAFPLHIACEFSSVKVVKYLMDMLDERTWNHLDVNKDSILHYACRGGNCEVVKYLINMQNPHVSERNVDEKLPIHLLCGASSDS